MKLNVKRTVLVGFAFMLISLFWQMYDGIMGKMLVDTFGFNQTWSGVVLALDNILALILLPVFGLLSDRTNTKLGRRTPYIIIGTIVAAILIVGVGIFDFYQYQAVQAHGIGPVVEVESGDAPLYNFLVNDVHYFTTGVADKGEVSMVRSALVFKEVTKANPTYLVFFILILLVVLVAMSSFRTPAVSLMPDVTPKPLRSKANAVINLMGTVGGIISLGYMTFLTNETSSIFADYRYVPAIVATSIIMLIMLAVFLSTVRERKWVEDMRKISLQYDLAVEEEFVEPEKGKKPHHKMPKDVRKSFILILSSVVLWFMAYNAATSKFALYATNVLDQKTFTLPLIVAYATAFVAFVPIGFISTKFGRRKTILAGIIILTVAFLLAIFASPRTAFLMYITMGTAGIGWATINVNSYPMVVELSTEENVGVYTGYYYSASMSAQIVTPILSGLIMDLVGSYRPLFYYCTVFSALAFVTMFFVKHGDAKKIDTPKLAAETTSNESVIVEEVTADEPIDE